MRVAVTVRDRQAFAQRIMAAKDECEALKDTYAEILQARIATTEPAGRELMCAQVFLNAHQVTEAQVTIDGSLSALQQQCRRLLRPPEGESTKAGRAALLFLPAQRRCSRSRSLRSTFNQCWISRRARRASLSACWFGVEFNGFVQLKLLAERAPD